MADKKISQLTAATTPLDGTEVLPIVQNSATVKVANNDLRPKQIQSNATSGVLQVVGPAAASTRVMTVPNANFTVARTDAANSFTGDQTLATGNLVQGTASKGINFTANTPASGMTSQLLNWYEEGTWTPSIAYSTSGSASMGTQTGRYTRVGRLVTVQCVVSWLKNTGVGDVSITGLPFTSVNIANYQAVGAFGADSGLTGTSGGLIGVVSPNTTSIKLYQTTTGTWATIAAANTVDGGGQWVYLTLTYQAA